MQCSSRVDLHTEIKGDDIYTCLRVGGADRVDFLQGQLTQDVAALDERPGLPAAWCNPKGRTLVTGRLLALDEAIGFVVPTPSADTVLKRLTLYRLRSKVDLEIESDVASMAVNQADLPDTVPQPAAGAGSVAAGNGLVAVRLSTGIIEVYGPRSSVDSAGLGEGHCLSQTDWQIARIEAGLVDIDVATAERFTPHMLNLDRVGAISFTKGCYTGQEVVARTENLGKAKRRLNRYRLAGGSASPGDRLTSAGSSVGEVVNAAGAELLAIVPVDRHAEVLELDGSAATPQPLPYRFG